MIGDLVGDKSSAKRTHEANALGADRTLQALVLLGRSSEGLTISQMASELGTSRQVIYRLVGSLQAAGFAFRGDDSKVRLGIAVLDIAAQVFPTLRSVASPVLRRLADKTMATAHLTVASGDQAHAIAVEEPSFSDFHIAYRVGATHPLERGAAGKAILKLRSHDRGLEDSCDTNRPSSDGHPVRGWVLTEGELQFGAKGIAYPIRGVPGLEASVGVICLGNLDESFAGPLVICAADEIAALVNR